MSYAPVVPPLPQDFNQPRRRNSKPPIPPLPPNFHPEHPMAAPMPERAMPTLPADMARSLDESLYHPSRAPSLHPVSPYPPDYRRPSPAPQPPPPGAAFPGGFAPPPSGYAPSPYGPPRPGPTPAPYGGPNGFAHNYSLPNALSSMTLAPQPPPPRSSSAQGYRQSQQPVAAVHPPQPAGPPAAYPPAAYPNLPARQESGPPDLTAPLPTLDSLAAAQRALPQRPGPDHVPWIRDVLFLVDRTQQQGAPAAAPPEGPVVLSDPVFARLATDAVQILLALLAASPAPPLPPWFAEATYLRGTLHSSGAFPSQVQRSPRDAFREFEAAARAGVQRAWFRLGRDYEAVGDASRARDCFERGVRAGVESCLYRMGMARLLGQLGLPASPPDALPLLHRAATLASTEAPQPAYVYGLILLGEFSHVRVDERVIAALIPPGSSAPLEARKFVERAAYLGFAPAQYKLGHAYEYAVSPFPFDPLLSVQYYSLASQQGEPEADMALSKWFLCGAEGAFEKDEALAVTFADKAARKGLGSAEFAMGYYSEVGVGGPKDIVTARKWYAKAVEHGNADAPERLSALTQPAPQALSRTEHDAITDARLVRRRTQARISAVAAGRHSSSLPSVGEGAIDGAEVVERMRAQAQAQPLRQSPQPMLPAVVPPAAVPQAQPRPPPSQVPEAQIRYSLTDAPVGSLPTSPAPASHSTHGPAHGRGHGHGRAAGRPPGRRHESSEHVNATAGAPAPIHATPPAGPSPASSHPGSPALPLPNGNAGAGTPRPGGVGGAATFAEMGFQSGKAEDKECVIM